MEHRGAVALRVERAIAEDCFVLVAVGVLDGGSAQGLCERVTDALADGGAVALDLAALESCDERAAFMLAQLTARRVAPNRSRISLMNVSSALRSSFEEDSVRDLFDLEPHSGAQPLTLAAR